MDLNETTKAVINRHPWELSRTKCVLNTFSKYIDSLHGNGMEKNYINVGAGDLYFDRALLAKYPMDKVYAVDIGYQDMKSQDSRIYKYHYLEEIQEKKVDYAIMMDSLEYMENDVAYVNDVSQKIQSGGYFFFTLPAFPWLFSEHDVNVKNLRRYSRKSFEKVISEIPELVIEDEFNFYTSLFLVRFVQKLCRLPIDPHHNVTAGWTHSERGIVTYLLTGCLNLDFKINQLFSKAGIRLPGLSMLVICKKA